MQFVDLLSGEQLLDQVPAGGMNVNQGAEGFHGLLKNFAWQWQTVHLYELLLIYTGRRLIQQEKIKASFTLSI